MYKEELQKAFKCAMIARSGFEFTSPMDIEEAFSIAFPYVYATRVYNSRFNIYSCVYLDKNIFQNLSSRALQFRIYKDSEEKYTILSRYYSVNPNLLDNFGSGLYIGNDGNLIAGIDTAGLFSFNPPGINDEFVHVNSAFRHRKDTEDILVPEEVANRGIKFLIRTQSILSQSTVSNMNIVKFARNPDSFRDVLIAKIARFIELAGRNN
jgi:hypothetical protein